MEINAVVFWYVPAPWFWEKEIQPHIFISPMDYIHVDSEITMIQYPIKQVVYTSLGLSKEQSHDYQKTKRKKSIIILNQVCQKCLSLFNCFASETAIHLFYHNNIHSHNLPNCNNVKSQKIYENLFVCL